MFQTTLYLKHCAGRLTLDTTDRDSLNNIMGNLAGSPSLEDLYEISSNGATEYTNVKNLRPLSRGRLSEDFALYKPKHPGGRPRKETECPVCHTKHPSYSEARVCCWRAKKDNAKKEQLKKRLAALEAK